MKVNIIGNNQTASNLPLETFNYRLDDSAEAVALIAETLRKSYKYPVKTSVQEYLSNARDVHRENKVKKAIDVQIPTELQSEFFIRDYGTGLSKEEMKDYITFAKSTKRHSNTATGGFGFGSKSFFAYTDSFTIISYYNGVKYIYRASCVKSKEGALILVSQNPTKEPSGLQVQVAVRQADRKEFQDAIFRLKCHWQDQEIHILNLNKEEYPKEDQIVLSENNIKVWKKINQHRNYGNDSFRPGYGRYSLNNSQVFLLVDSIPYGIDNFEFENKDIVKFFSIFNQSYNISISVNTGDITLSKYREYIEATPDNKQFIEKTLLNMIQDFHSAQAKKYGRLTVKSFDEITETNLAPYLMLSTSTEADFIVGASKHILKIDFNRGYNPPFSITLKSNFDFETLDAKTVEVGYRIGKLGCDWSNSPTGFYPQGLGEIRLQNHESNKMRYYSVGESKEIMRQRLMTLTKTASRGFRCGLIVFKEQPSPAQKDMLTLLGYTSNLSDIERTKPERVAKDPTAQAKPKKKRSPPVEKFTYEDLIIRNSSWNGKKMECTLTKTSMPKTKPIVELADKNVVLFKDTELDKLANKIKDYYSQEAWGVKYILVNEENYNKMIKRPNTYCASKFSFNKLKSDKDFKAKAEINLVKVMESRIKESEVFKQLEVLARYDLISEVEKNQLVVIKEYKGKNQTTEQAIEEAGLKAEYDKLYKASASGKLMEKYSFLCALYPLYSDAYQDLSADSVFGKNLRKILSKMR